MSARLDCSMTRRRCGAFLAAMMMLTLPVAAPRAADGAALRAPVERTLGNGLRVVVFPDPRLELVQFQLRVRAGLTAEPLGQAGVAYVVAEMLRRGTTSRDPRAFADAVGNTGGSIVPNVGRDYATLSGTVLARDFETGIELMSDGALYPVFDEGELRRIRSQGLRQLAQTQNNPGLAAEDQIWKGMFSLHPYGRSPYGEAPVLANIDAVRVRAFWSERWRPDHAVLAIAGDVTPERAFLIAEEWFGRWSGNSGSIAARPPITAPERARIRLIDRPAERAELRIGTLGPARGDDDEFALFAAGSLFGAAPARRPNGVRTLYEREMRAGFLALGDAGLFTISASAPIDSAAEALRSLTTMMGTLATPASAEDFASVQRLMKNALPMSLETLASRTSSWLAVDSYGNAAQFFDRYDERVDGLTPAAVASAARRWIDPARAVIVAIGPAAQLRPQLEQFGDVEIVSAAGASPDNVSSATTQAPAKATVPTATERLRGRALVRKAAVAHGGLAKLRAIRDSRVEASLTLNVAGQKLEGLMVQTRREPDHMVYIIEVAGIATRQTLLGNEAWQITGSDSVARDMDPVTVGALRAGFSSDLHHLLLVASDPTAHVWTRGTMAIGDVDAIAVVVEHPGHAPRTLYLHPVRNRVIGFDQGEPGRGGMLARRKFSEFRTVGGILWPYREERQLNGETVMIVDIRDVRFNTGVSDIAFEKPVAGPGTSR